ncbi:MAG: thioredoxin family protein [Alphaproteobacteria bacterium]|nr:thioredoxin family protein [Alphaproteobacteria bacterium]
MALLQTPEKAADFAAPDFRLKNVDGRVLSLADVRGPKGFLAMFICNHCPYVQAVIGRLVEDCTVLQKAGIGCAAIMPNDTKRYPDDSFEKMKTFAAQHHFTFPYLIDETQDVAKAYGAVCTPDLFGFDARGVLQYRGRVDSAGPKVAGPDTVRELRQAMLETAEKGFSAASQFPSMGCSIKWKE